MGHTNPCVISSILPARYTQNYCAAGVSGDEPGEATLNFLTILCRRTLTKEFNRYMKTQNTTLSIIGVLLNHLPSNKWHQHQ